jgi:hypothetical protein
MNNLSGVLAREFITENSQLNILWTHIDNRIFTNMIGELGHRLLSVDDLYFANKIPQLIICNDIISSYKKIHLISLQFHLPVIIIDHNILDNIIDNSKLEVINSIPCVYRIAINKQVFSSWNQIHNDIISIDRASKNLWNETIINTAKRVFTL